MRRLVSGLVVSFFCIYSPINEAAGIHGYSLNCIENCEKQLADLRKYARNGSPRAQTLLGILYKTGEMEVEPDPDEAWRWMKRAKRQRFAAAQFTISQWYRSGYRDELDVERADKYLAMASKQGYVPAVFEHGMRMAQSGEVEQGVALINKTYKVSYPLALHFAKNVEQIFVAKEHGSADLDNAKVTNSTQSDRPKDENTITVFGSPEKPEFLFANLLDELKESNLYNKRGYTGSRLGDLKCGQAGSGCKVIKFKNVFDYDMFIDSMR